MPLRARLKAFLAVFLPLAVSGVCERSGEPVRVRVVAANLTSGTEQAYSPTNGNHSNIEGAGARILTGLKADVVLIQEFNTSIPPRQWVNQTFGPDFSFVREEGPGIPNGIISRFPVISSGEWDDPTQANRDFAWAKLGLPNGAKLWAVSVHLKSGNSRGDKETRLKQAETLAQMLRTNVPAADYVVLGGDFNTSSRRESSTAKLADLFHVDGPYPADEQGNSDTNAPRRKPYDWLIADAELHPRSTPATFGPKTFAHGLVVDTRVFDPLPLIAPAKLEDSGAPGMQHMAVVRDFVIPPQ
jgi:endonuclease/exonuclease/phosphatase family metal-dependent hydrolase